MTVLANVSESFSKDEEIEDLEVCSREGRQPRCVRKYRIRIDKEYFVVPVTAMTGRQLLELAGKCDISRWKIFQKLKGGAVTVIGLDQSVDFTTPGIEKFNTLPIDQTEGESPSNRREFQLPTDDLAHLDKSYPSWHAVKQGAMWLLVDKVPLPEGFTVRDVTVALRIEPGYPDAQIDMAYFFPAIIRKDGKAIPATESFEVIDGRSFQRWSRHRTAENPWRPGIDDVSTHLTQVHFWMEKEAVR